MSGESPVEYGGKELILLPWFQAKVEKELDTVCLSGESPVEYGGKELILLP